MTNFESNLELLKSFHKTAFSENFINAYIASHITSSLQNISADTETMKGHGKVDVLVHTNEGFEYIIETKNYYNISDLEFVYKQILNRIHHRFLYASIVLLVNGFQINTFRQILEQINKWIKDKNGHKRNIQTLNNKAKSYNNFFICQIKNLNTGYDIMLNIGCYHLEFNINHAKKDDKIDPLYDQIKNKSKQFIKLLHQINNLKSEQIEQHINNLKESFIKIINSCYEYNEYFLKPNKK
ncbi:MAG: hypothetical protein Q8888_02410 [Vigna little leaf phytoplasma]|nr:hypothetical protein [Vigna little leaf phytoplasma]